MPKNIALFIDGTWNRPMGETDTNVRKLYEDATKNGGPNQVTHYMSGVGTEIGDNENIPPFVKVAKITRGLGFLPRRVRNVLGGAFGWGTSFKIKEAYAFLCADYEHGDHVFIFGFSRGAFAARSLAGFVEQVGLLYRDQIDLVEEAYAQYESPSEERRNKLQESVYSMAGRTGPFVEGENALPIYMIGVWDTVGALGIPRREADMPAYFTEFHQTELPRNVTHARHALALHELRQKFEPLLWMGHQPWQSLKQVWFPGAHADVGGGYLERYLSDAALQWMAKEAKKVGLSLRDSILVQGSPLGPERVHHELRGVFLGCRATVRRTLREHDSLSPSLLRTFALHKSACDRLRDPVSQYYRYWRPRVNVRLRDVDLQSLRMLVTLYQMNGPDAVID